MKKRYSSVVSSLLSFLIISLPSYAQEAEPYRITAADVVIEGNTIVKYLWPRNAEKERYSNIIIPSNFEGVSITQIGRKAFDGGFHLESVVIEDGIKYIGARAFYMQNLKDLRLPNDLISIGDSAFCRATYDYELPVVELPQSVENIGIAAFESSNMRGLILSKKLTEIPERAFMYTSIDEIELHEGITKIGVDAFAGNPISHIELPQSLRYLSGFAGTKITTINIPATVEVGDNAFAGTESLSHITIEDGVKRIGDRAFNGAKVSDFYIPASVEHVGYCGVPHFDQLEFAEGIEQIDSLLFACTHILSEEQLILPSTLKRIQYKAFSSCYGYPVYETLTIPQNIEYIGEQAYVYDFVRNIELQGNDLVVADSAFAGNMHLANLTVGCGVKELGRYSFACTQTYRYVKVDLSNATDLEHIKPNAFADALLEQHIKLPSFNRWASYTTSPDELDEIDVTTIRDASKGYVVIGSTVTNAERQQMQEDTNPTYYDLSGRKSTGNTRGVILQKGKKTLKK
ncbi:MAG: hypothetical protein E7069_04385 [Bacteroidales bacterium]|jgi:hypothetical protein|nr:hypothetical protein [Bacteroidales bacterium]